MQQLELKREKNKDKLLSDLEGQRSSDRRKRSHIATTRTTAEGLRVVVVWAAKPTICSRDEQMSSTASSGLSNRPFSLQNCIK